MEVGTLKDLNVKPGDVVECVSEAGCFTVGNHYFCHGEGRIKDDDGDEWPLEHSGIYPRATFRVVSRAIDLTAITTPFGLLDAATQDALRAHGGPYEFYSWDGVWRETPIEEGDDFFNANTYRVKPAPKRETVTVKGLSDSGQNVILTVDLIDGKPDLTAVREAR